MNIEVKFEETNNKLDVDFGETQLVSGGGGYVKVDTSLSESSTNPVQNKVITQKILELENSIPDEVVVDTELSTESENPVQNKVVAEALGEKLDKFVPKSTARELLVAYKNANGKIEYGTKEISFTPKLDVILYTGENGTLRVGNPTADAHAVTLGYMKANIGHRYKFTLTSTDDTSIKYYLYHDTKTNINTVTNTAIVDILKEFEVIPTLAYMKPNVGGESVPYGVLSLKAAVDNGDGTPITINITGYINKVNNNSDGLETEFLSFKKVSVTMEKIY
jgi:hypothetical protein